MVLKKTKEEGSTNGSTFTPPLYNGIKDSYGVDSIGYYWVIGVLERNTTSVGVTTLNGGFHTALLPSRQKCR